MADQRDDARMIDRRKFLKGSALFAAAVGAGLAMASPAAAQEQTTQTKPAEKKNDEAKKDDDSQPKKLVDKDGREYRVCDMCGGNMYKFENTWTCEQCGFSYTE